MQRLLLRKLLRNPHLQKQDTGKGFLGHPGQAGITTALSKYVSLCGHSNAPARLSDATCHVPNKNQLQFSPYFENYVWLSRAWQIVNTAPSLVLFKCP